MSDSTILIDIVEEVAELIRQGKNPKLQDYVHRFPTLAAELQRVVPLIGQVEQFGNAIPGDLNNTLVSLKWPNASLAHKTAPATKFENNGVSLCHASRLFWTQVFSSSFRCD